MSDATSDDTGPVTLSWLQATVAAVLITAICLAFSFSWEAIAQLIGDF
jgi:hypothetical protein